MARRPFEPPTRGWVKTRYQQGDILDRGAVDALVAQADVVIHLAFLIDRIAQREHRTSTCRAHVTCSRPRSLPSGPRRLVYTSSVAAYGYHSDNPVPLTEDVPTRGSDEHYYSEQKAACEAALADITKDSSLGVFVLRPCIVAGPAGPGVGERGAVEAAARPGARGGQGGAGVEAGRAGSGFPVAAGPPRRRRDGDRAGGHGSGAARRVQHRRYWGSVDRGRGEGAGWPTGAGSRHRRLGGVGGDLPAAGRRLPPSNGCTSRDIGGDGHQKSAARTSAGARRTRRRRRWRRWRKRCEVGPLAGG